MYFYYVCNYVDVHMYVFQYSNIIMYVPTRLRLLTNNKYITVVVPPLVCIYLNVTLYTYICTYIHTVV